MRNEAHRKQFEEMRKKGPKKGDPSPNPSGRPKRRPITDAYIAMSKKRIPKRIREQLGLPDKAIWADAVAYGQFIHAAKGHASNASEIREAIEGKATQRIELSGSSDADARPIEVRSVDITKLSKEELLAYRAIVAKSSTS
jgi:hypothetical protein